MEAPPPSTDPFATVAEQGSVDWAAWHAGYGKPDSELGRRLALVQAQLRDALDRAAPGPIRAISVCSGQGHDLIGVLAEYPRRTDVSARLVELDAQNVLLARGAARAIGLDAVEVIAGDASLTDAYGGAVPADVVLLCGVFGNISVADVGNTIEQLGQLCAAEATVIWTRHRHPPDLVPYIRETFEQAGFEELSLEDAPPFAVGANRMLAPPRRCGPASSCSTSSATAPCGHTSVRASAPLSAPCSARTARWSSWSKRCARCRTVARASRAWIA